VSISREEFAKTVLEYFLRNPEASDNLEGIARWRVLEQIVRYAVSDTQKALDYLVASGYLKQTPIAGCDSNFSLNLANREAAERFVRGAAAEETG
jgi:hypothetical protein